MRSAIILKTAVDHTTTASKLLDKIECAGLVRRERKHADQRVVQRYLTENGELARGQLSDDTLSRLNQDLATLIAHRGAVDYPSAQNPLSQAPAAR